MPPWLSTHHLVCFLQIPVWLCTMETISTPNRDPKNYITEFKLETVATEWVKLRWTSFLFKPSVLFPQERTWREFCNHCEWNGESISSCKCFVNFLLLTKPQISNYAHHACVVPCYFFLLCLIPRPRVCVLPSPPSRNSALQTKFYMSWRMPTATGTQGAVKPAGISTHHMLHLHSAFCACSSSVERGQLLES